MKTVAAIFTTYALIEPVKKVFGELMPKHRLVDLLDDSLVPDILSVGNAVTVDIKQRMLAYCQACENIGASVILSTCASMGDVVDQIRPFVKLPILKIDEPMIRYAVENGSSIAVMMTNPSVAVPTTGLVRSVSEKMGKPVRITERLVEGAAQVLSEGNGEKFDQLLLAAASDIAHETDVFVLAQGSMARTQDKLAAATGKPVLASLRTGLTAVKSFLDK